MTSLDSLLSSVFLFVSFILVCIYPTGNHVELGAHFTFMINGFFWFVLLVWEGRKRKYSLLFMHLLFCYLFFFIAAFVQYKSNIYPWGRFFDDEIIFYTNVLLFVWTFFFYLGGLSCESQKKVKWVSWLEKEVFFDDRKACFCLLISIMIIVYRLSNIGFLALFTRSESASSGVVTGMLNQPLYLLFSYLSLYTVFFTLLYCLLGYRHEKNIKTKLMLFVASFLLFVGYPPTGIARFLVAAIYGGILFTVSVLFRKYFKVLFSLSFLFIFPSLEVFRNGKIGDVLSSAGGELQDLLTWDYLNIFYQGHYDAYTVFCDVVRYVSIEGITWCRQLVGVVLFFVPRFLWKEKPTGTGDFVSHYMNYSFNNISCPLPAEVYINFGEFGFIVMAFLLGYLLSYLDKVFWTVNKQNITNASFNSLYFSLMFFMFFISRGDLMSSVAFVLAFIFVWRLLYVGRTAC